MKVILKGGEGSGHKGHAGRPGSIGGSVAGTAGDVAYYMDRFSATLPVVRPSKFRLNQYRKGRGGDVYHVTISDSVMSIAKNGLIPAASGATGQSFKAEHSDYATYFHSSESAARSNMEQGVGQVAVIGSLPRTVGMAHRILPDEDAYPNPNDGLRSYLTGGPIAVVAGLERENITGFVIPKGTMPKSQIDKLKTMGYVIREKV